MRHLTEISNIVNFKKSNMMKAFHSLLFFLMLLCFGSVQLFSQGTFVDSRDGEIYKTVKINGKTWMAENLRYYNDGRLWETVVKSVNYPASKYPDNIAYNPKKYGRLYTWEQAKVACPVGWHLPRKEEWSDLLTEYTVKDRGRIPSAEKREGFDSLIDGGSTGFDALLGGRYSEYSGFTSLGQWGFYWSSTSYTRPRHLDSPEKFVYLAQFLHSHGLYEREAGLNDYTDGTNPDHRSYRSCRCVKGVMPPEPLGGLEKSYTIQQKVNNRYVDAHPRSNEDFRAVTRPKSNNIGQVWKIKSVGKDTYTIQQLRGWRYLDAHPRSNMDYSAVTRPGNGGDGQKWIMKPIGKDTYTIQQKRGMRYLDAYGTSSKDYKLVTRPSKGTDAQKWIIKLVSDDTNTTTNTPKGNAVALKTVNDQYVSAKDGGGSTVAANRTRIGTWETFIMEELGNDKVAFKTHNGHYLSAKDGGGSIVAANKTRVGTWETFTKVELGGKQIALKTHKGYYVAAKDGGGGAVIANSTQRGQGWIYWENFTVVNR